MFVTAQPHAHVRFRRAIERLALWLAEDAARELRTCPRGRPYSSSISTPSGIAEVREGGAAALAGMFSFYGLIWNFRTSRSFIAR